MDEHLLAAPTDRARSEPYRQAIVAADRLRKALNRHGIDFPSLRGDFPTANTPRLHLGMCSARDAEALAQLLEDTLAAAFDHATAVGAEGR